MTAICIMYINYIKCRVCIMFGAVCLPGKGRITAMEQLLADLIAPLVPKEVRQDIGFTSRILAQATMPHRNPGDVRQWERSNGALRLVIQPGPDGALPYGSIPRLLLAWVTTEAVRTKERELVLGNTLSSFLDALGLGRTGGEKGDITRLRRQ